MKMIDESQRTSLYLRERGEGLITHSSKKKTFPSSTSKAILKLEKLQIIKTRSVYNALREFRKMFLSRNINSSYRTITYIYPLARLLAVADAE